MTGPPALSGEAALADLVGLGRALRAAGLPVGPDRVLTFCRAAGLLPVAGRAPLYWSARATMLADHTQLEVFDACFDAWWAGERGAAPRRVGRPPPAVRPVAVHDASAGPQAATDRPGQPLGLAASAIEVLRTKSFPDLDEAERAAANLLVRRLAVRLPHRPSRRLRRARRGRAPDLRRSLRAALRTDGELLHRKWRQTGTRPRPVLLVLDVSGSMSDYARPLLQFGFAALAAGHRVEVFCFGTRLTRVTRVLRARDPDRALREVASVVLDFDGGTRIGESLRELIDRWGQRATLRGAVVVICSDGLDRGEPEVLGAQMARLRRLARRVVWVNPLAGGAGYEPLARGMAAALPYVDRFLPGHNLASLEALGEVLED